jgi:hypothetical protein
VRFIFFGRGNLVKLLNLYIFIFILVYSSVSSSANNYSFDYESWMKSRNDELISLAKAGDVNAQSMLCRAIVDGFNIKGKDLDFCIQAYRKNDAFSMYNIGIISLKEDVKLSESFRMEAIKIDKIYDIPYYGACIEGNDYRNYLISIKLTKDKKHLIELEKSIERQKEISKIAGVVNESVMYSLGSDVIDTKERIDNHYNEYKKNGGSMSKHILAELDNPCGNIKSKDISVSEISLKKNISILNKKIESMHKEKVEKMKEQEKKEAIKRQEEEKIERDARLQQDKLEWMNAVSSHIRRHRVMRSNENVNCDVYVRQDRNGVVKEVNIKGCDGDITDAYKESIVAVMRRASPLPIAPSDDVFRSEMILKFK